MRIFLFIIVTLSCFANLAHGQKFQSGYILLTDSTLLQGQIKYIPKPPRALIFRENDQSREQSVHPSYCDHFMMNGVKYVYKSFMYKVKGEQKEVAVFMENIISGPVNLYKFDWPSRTGNEHIYQQNKEFGVAIPLGNRVGTVVSLEKNYGTDYFLERNDGELYQVPKNKTKFFRALRTYFADCQPLIQKIEQGEFKKKDLDYMVTIYNICSENGG